MDLRSVLYGLLLCCCLCLVSSQELPEPLEVHFLGNGLYPAMSDAILQCQISSPPEDVSNMVVSWWLGPMSSNKLARSVADQNASFVYNTAKAELRPRFSVSSAKFSEGIAESTIQAIEISDENVYACEVEVERLQKRTSFKVRVYKLPVMRIENINTELDIREKPEDPTEPPTSAVEEEADESTEPADSAETTGGGSDATAENTETPAGENDATAAEKSEADEDATEPSSENSNNSPLPDDGKITIVRCLTENVYPMPSKILFATDNGGMEWEVLPDNFFQTVQNSDGSYNVTARLRIEPNSELDGKTISCTSYITEMNHATSSPRSNRITVKHTTSKVDLQMRPKSTVSENERVTISCQADGNPPPRVILTLPNQREEDLSNGKSHSFTATRETEGRYTCRASNSEGGEGSESVESEMLQVLWMDEPSLTGPASAEEVRVGMYLELQCYARSNSKVRYQWYKDDVSFEDNKSTLTFEKLTVKNSGNYRCEATTNFHSKSTSVSLDVQYECVPEIEYKVSSSTKTPGNAHLVVECKASGNPACNVVLSTSLDKKLKSEEMNKATLTLDDLPKQKNHPQFNCTASNSLAKELKSVTTGNQEGDSLLCCGGPEETSGGASTGVVIIIVVVSILAVIGVFVACYVIKSKEIDGNFASDQLYQELSTMEEIFKRATLCYAEANLAAQDNMKIFASPAELMAVGSRRVKKETLPKVKNVEDGETEKLNVPSEEKQP